MKKITFLLTLMLLTLGIGSAWAAEVTFTPSEFTAATNADYSLTKGNVTVAVKASTVTADQFRIFKNKTLTVSAANGDQITSIEFTCTASGTTKYGPGCFAAQTGYSYSEKIGTWTGDATSVSFTASSDQVRATKIVITYTTAGSGSAPVTPVQLGTPSNLTAVPAETSATLSWDAVANASNYSVTVNGNTSEVNTTTYEATGLTAATEYTWSVTAKGDGTNYTDSEAATSTFTTASASVTPDPGASSANVTYDFTKIDGLSSWGNSYAEHIVTYSDAKVTFEAASKQTSNVTDCPVTKGKYVTLVMTDGGTLSSVEWVCKQWTTKTQTITLHYSTDGGNTYTSTGVTSNNFTISSKSLPTGTNAVKITFSSTNNQVGISSCTITKVTSDEPQPVIVKTLKSIAVTPTTTTYEQGDVFKFDGTCTATYSVTKDDVAYADETKEVTPTSVSTPDMSTTGDKVVTVSYTEGEVTVKTTYTITVTENTITPGTYPGNLNNAFFGCATGNNAEEQSGKLEDILVVSGCTQSATTKTSYQSDHVRYYADNYLKFSAPAGYLISAIQFTAYSSSFKWDGEITATVGTYDADGKSWSGSAQEVQFNFGKQNRIASVSVTYAEASKYALTITTPSNGTLTIKEGENAVATGDKFYAGTQLTVTATPEEGYKLASVSVVDGSSNDVTASVYDNGTLTMPEYDVTISATFEAAKTLTSIEITTPATQTTFWQGETFNSTGLVVTAHFDGAADEVVTPTVTGSTTTAGTQTVTVSYTEGTVTKTATYTIEVKAIPNTKETAYSVTDAYDIIDKLTTATGVFITGTISQVDSYNSTYKSITYWISADGTTTNQLQAYSGKGLESADFTAVTDLTVGDKVIVCGNLKKHNSTYEFDYNNYLAAYTPTTKDPAGLVYATTEYTANVGEAFATPTLTNPNNLTVTYSTSDATKATVDAATGEVTIVAVGKVTITASTTGDATHDAGTASYTITISDPALAIATLPFTYNSGKAAIETTAGITHSGLGTDYNAAPYLKFDHTGDNIIIHFDSQADELSYDIKGNPGQGTFSCTFAVQESEDGSTYTDLVTYTTLETTTTNKTHKLAPASRYVKFVFTEKSNGNVALGNISITKPDLRQEAGIAWSAETTAITIGDAFTAPTLSNPNGLTLTCTSDNENLATVTNAGVITLKSGATGKANITAAFAGDTDYKAAEVKTTIIVAPVSSKVVILAQYQDQWYALKAEYPSGREDRIAALPVNYVDGRLYNVVETDKAAIEWNRVVLGDKVAFENGGIYLKGETSTNLILQAGETGLYLWDATSNSMMIDDKERTFMFNGEVFRNYAVSNAGNSGYSSLPVVTAPVYVNLNTASVKTIDQSYFSVGNNKYVQFSTGNLQYEVGTNTWSFASKQYEVIGGAAYDGTNNTNFGMNVPGYIGKLDLFGWSSDGKFGVNPSNTDAHYGYAGSDFVDWGTLVNETGWCTLTKDEMKHILARTKNGKELWALATVNGLNGLILLPDNWNTSISLVYGYVPTQFVYTENQLTIAQWEALEAEGAVFLPAGGSRTGGYGNEETAGGKGSIDANGHYFHVDNVGVYGYYWLNTQDTRPAYPHCASFLMLPGWDEGPTVDEEGLDDLSTPPVIWSREKRRGNSVRLVKEVKPDYTREGQGAGVYGTVCYPENIVWCDGAILYEVAGKEGNKVIFDEVTTPEAGMPYIFIADQEVINFFCGTDEAATAGEKNSLKGTFEKIDPEVEDILKGHYVLYKNIIKKCGANCGLLANRAYFVATELEGLEAPQSQMPGRRRISLDVQSENTTTDLDNITNGENTTIKTIENGQLIIIRNGEKYNAQGVRF